jgi:hypothetical protein
MCLKGSKRSAQAHAQAGPATLRAMFTACWLRIGEGVTT